MLSMVTLDALRNAGSIAGDNVLHVVLLGLGGVIYIPHTLVPLRSLGLDSQRV